MNKKKLFGLVLGASLSAHAFASFLPKFIGGGQAALQSVDKKSDKSSQWQQIKAKLSQVARKIDSNKSDAIEDVLADVIQSSLEDIFGHEVSRFGEKVSTEPHAMQLSTEFLSPPAVAGNTSILEVYKSSESYKGIKTPILDGTAVLVKINNSYDIDKLSDEAKAKVFFAVALEMLAVEKLSAQYCLVDYSADSSPTHYFGRDFVWDEDLD